MKKIIILLCPFVFSLFLSSSSYAFQEYWFDAEGCISISSNIDLDQFNDYTVFEDKWYYGLCPVETADKETFEAIEIDMGQGKEFAKDKNYFYFHQDILSNLNPAEVKIEKYKLEAERQTEADIYLVYDKDSRYLWNYNGNILADDVDLATFKFYGGDQENRYYTDKNSVYKEIEIHSGDRYSPVIYKILQPLRLSDPAHFDFGYKITDTAVYWYGRRIEEADAGSFQLFHLGYAKDKNNVYFEGETVYGVDAKSFTELGSYYLDKNGRYLRNAEGKIIETIKDFKQAYIDHGKSPDIVDEALNSAISDYETKYPGYTPKPAQPQQIFKDIPVTHPLYLLTKKAKEQGWIAGYPDGTFKPDVPVNRAEFAKMLMMAFYKGDGKESVLAKFPDVLKNVWYTPYLSRAVELKIMEGYPDGKMWPGNTIIKAEALKMALVTAVKTYDAQKEGEAWYERYRRYAEENFKLDFTKLEDMPKQMTRGECVELILEVKKEWVLG